MKKNRYILAGLTAATLLATACSEIDDDQLQQEQTVPVTFYLRSAGPNTRATEDIKPGTEAENAIHTAKVWLYQSAYTEGTTNHAPLLLGYQDASFSDNDDEREITINIPKAVADARRKLDVYAVANAASVGLTGMNAGSNEAPNTFDNVYIAGTNFTPKTLTASPGIPTTGLPMSQIAKNQDIITSGTGAPYTLNKIDLVRAISKIRFAFARPTGMQNVEITGIEIDGNLIPNQERIFPLQSEDNANYAKVGDIQFNGDRYTNINKTGTAPDYEGTYISDVMRYGSDAHNTTLISTANIFEHVWPKWFSIDYAGVTGKTYEERIDSLLQASNYDFTTYLRESDKPITGTIWYRIGSDDPSPATFSMSAPAEGEGPDFARNHIYTVYGHFEGRKLEVKPIVQKWDWENDHDYEYESKGPIEISIFGDAGKQSYKIFNPTPNSTGSPINWNNAYVGIYYGVETDPEEPLGMPLYSPMLHLSTAYKDTLTLYSSNPDFGFITMTMVPKTDENPFGRAYSEPMASVTIPKYTGTSDYPNKSEYTDTYFYVVPMTEKADIPTIDKTNLPADRITHVYLLDPDGYKQPINPSFMPGPNNIEIWFFYMNSLNAYQELDDYEG
ncbi:MAG: hypothetical protein IIZ97_10305 [Prevotella sp.]|nr:hypothetical protein [Prevotella sp.]